MNPESIDFIKMLFILGFTIHNIEEAVWLPKWSKFAKKFHEPVETHQFIFAVICVTILGYLLTALDFLYGSPGNLFNYIYLGFVGMMGINTIFPHLISTIILKKYAPGLITALFLNLPFSIIIIFLSIKMGINILYLILSIILISAGVLSSLKPLFKLGGKLINFSESK